MPENTVTRIIAGINGLGLLAAIVYLIAIDRSDQVPTVVAVGFAVIGTINAVLPSVLGKQGKGPKVPPMTILVLTLVLVGCDNPIAPQASAATITAGALT